MPKEETSEEYQLFEVSTQTELAIKTPGGEILNLQKALVELLNKTDEILKSIK